MAATLTLTALPDVPSIVPGDDLPRIIIRCFAALKETVGPGDVLVLAQKIVSKAEGRYVSLDSVWPSSRARELAPLVEKDARLVQLILNESTEVLRHRPGALIVVHRLGFVLANAGIDSSNIDAMEGDRVLLLPKDPDASCLTIRQSLQKLTGVDIGIIINDSLGRAWRNGTVGTALGVSGFPGLLDLRGTPDRNGRLLRVTEVGVADELAAAASLLMGQAAESRPIILARGFPHSGRDGSVQELIRHKHMDLFR
jgi:coenzyme F420-0:L-glutamate ligase/coenzyme F420-1:gamma-L-glutamate ligase